MKAHTIVIVDDHALVRDGLRSLLDSRPRLSVIGEAGSGEEAIELCAELRPDVAVMDLQLPGMDGSEATRQLVAAGTVGAVLVLTMFEDDDSLTGALRAGARGYVLKGAPREEIARSVEALAQGGVVFGSRVGDRALSVISEPSPTAGPLAELTDRERDVLELLAAGLPNAEIARQLFLSTNTVRNRLSSVFAKLHVSSRAEAMLLAHQAGIGPGASSPKG